MKTEQDSVVAMDNFIVDPMSYALVMTNVQKVSEVTSGDAKMVDAKRRAREFLGGLTSVR